ncbi:MAG: hypothetical protein V4687_01070 [Bacteroidota bacterium]
MKKFLEHSVVGLIGLFASVLAVVLFFTNDINHFSDLFKKPTPTFDEARRSTFSKIQERSIKHSNSETNFHYGTISTDRYYNPFFNFLIKIPNGAKIEKGDTSLGRGRAILLVLDLATDETYLSGLMITADRQPDSTSIDNGFDYLTRYIEQMSKGLKRETLDTASSKDIRFYYKTLGNRKFYNMSVVNKLNKYRKEVNPGILNYYSIFIKGYALVFMTAHSDNRTQTQVEEVLKTIEFDP